MGSRHAGGSRIRVVAAAVLTVLLAGCGASGSSSPGTSAGSTAVTPDAGPSAHLTGPVEKAVAARFTAFFSGSTPASEKISLVERGQDFAPVINAQAGGPMSQSTTVTVSAVTLLSRTRASVRYTILLGGVPALQDQEGLALKHNGRWVVGASTFCTLLGLEQSAPPLCKKVS